MHPSLNQLVVRAFMAVKAANERTDIPNTIVWHRLNGAYVYARFVLDLAKGHKSLTYIQTGEEAEKLSQLLKQYEHWNKGSNGDKRGDQVKTIFGFFDSILWSNRADVADGGKESLERARNTVGVILDYARLDVTHYAQIRYRLFAHLQHTLLPREDIHDGVYRSKAIALLAGFVLSDLSID